MCQSMYTIIFLYVYWFVVLFFLWNKLYKYNSTIIHDLNMWKLSKIIIRFPLKKIKKIRIEKLKNGI